MNCPHCGHSSRVVDSRPTPEGIRRRRECLTCGRRFTTHERVTPADVRVLKAHNRQAEDFSLDKLIAALNRVCKGCTISPQDIKQVAQSIEADLIDKGRSSIHSIEIAGMVLAHLEGLNATALRRFAANYADADGQIRIELPPKEGLNKRIKERQFKLFEDHG